MKSSTLRGAVGLLAFLLSFGATVFGQTTGTIRGTVIDPSGAVVARAKVTAIWQETQTSRETNTSGSGDYEFPVLPVGHYTVQVEASGFKKFVQTDSALTIAHVVVIDAILQLGSPR
jgi:hypothetical protein